MIHVGLIVHSTYPGTVLARRLHKVRFHRSGEPEIGDVMLARDCEVVASDFPDDDTTIGVIATDVVLNLMGYENVTHEHYVGHRYKHYLSGPSFRDEILRFDFVPVSFRRTWGLW